MKCRSGQSGRNFLPSRLLLAKNVIFPNVTRALFCSDCSSNLPIKSQCFCKKQKATTFSHGLHSYRQYKWRSKISETLVIRNVRDHSLYVFVNLIVLIFQLKKELSDALLAAEHERNNFKNEVRRVLMAFGHETVF